MSAELNESGGIAVDESAQETPSAGDEATMARQSRSLVPSSYVINGGMPHLLRAELSGQGGNPIRVAAEAALSTSSNLQLSVPAPVQALVTGDRNAPIAAEAKVDASAKLDADARVNAKIDADLNGQLDANAKVVAEAKVDANAKVAAEAKVDANAKVAAEAKVGADINANLGGTGTPLNLKLSSQLPAGRIRLQMPKIGLVFKFFGFKIFEFALEADGPVHIDTETNTPSS